MSLRFDEAQLERAREILGAGPICDECLGRPFARVGRGLANAERGQAVRASLSTSGKAGLCWVCGGLFDRVVAWADRAARRVVEIEFDTYLFGVRLTPRLEETEAFFNERFPSDEGESLKHAFNRVVGKEFEARLEQPATVDFGAPHVSFVIDLASDALHVHVASVYVYGRYRKLARGIPQTKWPCRRCRGRGCASCGFTGKQYPESVEEWIAAPLLEAAGAEAALLHGAGREDIDARMLGGGRPFVLEVLAPRRRTLDLPRLRGDVNDRAAGKVEVSSLSFVDRDTVALLKELHATKRYRALVEFGEPVSSERLSEALSALCGEIEQRTPHRVSHRRADRVRRRRLLLASGEVESARRAVLELEGEGGLYIKELVSGDGGRTNPNLSSLLGVCALVTELDVLEVRSGAFPDRTSSVDNGEALP
jgi:tRNA pseudouridine synthase 10